MNAQDLGQSVGWDANRMMQGSTGLMSLLLGCWEESGPETCRKEEPCLQGFVDHSPCALGIHLYDAMTTVARDVDGQQVVLCC